MTDALSEALRRLEDAAHGYSMDQATEEQTRALCMAALNYARECIEANKTKKKGKAR